MESGEKIALILAGGEGKRMRSSKPKVLCEVLFRPMISWVLAACDAAGIDSRCVVTGFEHEQLEDYLNGCCTTVLQPERLGTGHAVMMAEAYLREHTGSDVLVLNGDAPFIDARTILSAYAMHKQKENSVTLVTAELEDPAGYGRIVRDLDGLKAIVEQKDASEEEKKIREINSGIYWFRTSDLLEVLPLLTNQNAQGEYYLTDTIACLLKLGKRAGTFLAENTDVVLGANDRKGLLELNRIATKRVIEKHLENGVEFLSTDGILISPEVKIGAGTRILPNTILKNGTEIGCDCVIGPGSVVDHCRVGDATELNAVQATQSVIGSNVKIGPFTQIRPNSVIKDYVKIGDFVEIKNSVIDEYTAVAHLTYVGDSDVGRNVNFGCGVVTVNYDGEKKSRTTIGDNAFIGCNTNLVAPVKVGNMAYTAAGSTITKDVPDGALGIGRAKQENKEGFAQRKLREFAKKHELKSN